MSDLSEFITTTPIHNTHEHMQPESSWVDNGPDALADIFSNYITGDLLTAGATQEALFFMENKEADPIERFAGIKEAWSHCQHTGYGEAVRYLAKQAYGLDEITGEGILAAQSINDAARQPGERLRRLRDVGNMDHIQIDNFTPSCEPDPAGVDFFLFDLNWAAFCQSSVNYEYIEALTGIHVTDMASYNATMDALFEKYAPYAVAVKSQHAYGRTLDWSPREEADAEVVLQKSLKGDTLTAEERCCLGDWGWSYGLRLAKEHNLPFKLHTGYYAGNNNMPVSYIKSGNLCALLKANLGTTFVLMHIAYPYSDEGLAAIAKHYPNVYIDFCWAWSINPYYSCDVVRRLIHSVPINKIFAFGGDTFWPNASVAYAAQFRKWFTVSLEAEVKDGFLTEGEAIAVASRLMQNNQRDCFDLVGLRSRLADVK